MYAGARDGFWKLKSVEVSLKFMPRMRVNVLQELVVRAGWGLKWHDTQVIFTDAMGY